MGEIFITIPLFFTKAPYTKTAITLPELVRQTNAFSKKYRPGCSPKLLDSNPKALFLHYNVKCNKEDSDPAGHDVRIQFDVTKVQESQQAKDLDVQVSCSCPAFLYWGAQWNLHQRDGLLGQPRPKLVAPTDRMDLRSNFVICKHIYAVFERILPSVQHNIVKILREREVLRNKDKVRETPSRLKKLQDELKEKRDKEKLHKIKDKDVQRETEEAMDAEEQKQQMHEQDLKNKGKAPGPVDDLSPEEREVAEAPSKVLPEEVEMVEAEDDLGALQDLVQEETDKVEEAHKTHKPHVHKGLPYDVDEDGDDHDHVMRKFESLHVAATRDELKHGVRVVMLPGGERAGTVTNVVERKGFHQQDIKVGVRWDTGAETVESNWVLGMEPEKQQTLFASDDNLMRKFESDMLKQAAVDPYSIKPGDKVGFDTNPREEGIVLEVRLNQKYPNQSLVKVDWGNDRIHEIGVQRLTAPQRSLF